jgi:pSer/pThr/pTyr-binding forkhead associated (FHA) protein
MNEHAELQERLKLYQVFLKLYDHNRGLLDEILDLENGSRAAGVSPPYIQGFASQHQSYLVTNLIRGKTQALIQPQQVWVIGRDPRQSLIAIQDIRLSRCHAAIRYVADQGFYLIDLGSRNQSFVNGEPVRQVLLKDGDHVRLGSVAFSFFLCESTRTLGELSPEIVNRLNRWQLLGDSQTAPPDPTSHRLASFELDSEEDSIPTLDLYHETSSFLFPNDGEQQLF